MTGFENTKLTFIGNQMNNDHQRIDVFRLYPTMVIVFMLVTCQNLGLREKLCDAHGTKQCLFHRSPSLGSLIAHAIDSSVTWKERCPTLAILPSNPTKKSNEISSSYPCNRWRNGFQSGRKNTSQHYLNSIIWNKSW